MINRADQFNGITAARQADISPTSSPAGFWLGILIFVLLAVPKLRLVEGGIPLYFVDGLIFLLFVYSLRQPPVPRYVTPPIPKFVTAYLFFVCLGELRGMVAYMSFTDSIYMLTRFCLAISLFFIVPRIIINYEAIGDVLKGVLAGLLVSSVIVIMYSWGTTRSLVMSTVFSWNCVNPGSERMALLVLMHAGVSEATRGRSLVGAATMTTGFLGSVWPLAFLAYRWPGLTKTWRQLGLLVSIITPIAILMTYGRTAWLIVALIGSMISLFGFAGGRRNVMIFAVICLVVVQQYGLYSEKFMVGRVVQKTQTAIHNPLTGESESERFLSYVQPFEHLLKNPSWWLVGAGRTGEKMVNRGNLKAQLYDEAGLATHSAFAMAYYSYGLPAALIQVLLMISAYRIILIRLRYWGQREGMQKMIWQTLLMSWVGLTLWWLSGHAPVGEPRGVMLFFFLFGLLFALDSLMLDSLQSSNNQE